jgi:murein DD-endopeptidase MepM/ murein hydrolase activator NlpD
MILAISLNLIPPIPGAINVRDFYVPENIYASGHRGIDLLANENSPVLAAQDGYISHSGFLYNRWTISVTHNEPVKPIVKLGQKVKQGDVIGFLQIEGSHCFPKSCLHFGLKEGSTYFNPKFSFLKKYPILLPIYS